jgi:hypothetical protein
MMLPLWIGIPAVLLFVAFIVFAFRQGGKVSNPSDGTPPDYPGIQL